MAKLSSDGNSVTVEKGDSLWAIAQTYLGNGTKYTYLAQLNGISSPYYIYVGQTIKIKATSVSSSTVKKNNTTNSSTVKITAFGLQSNSDNTIFVTWEWTRSNTENYQVTWYYYTGDNVWFVGSDSSVTIKQSTYSPPSNATIVGVYVTPISATHTVNNTEVHYWYAETSTFKRYYLSDNPPSTPSVPSVEIDKYKLTAELDNLQDLNATSIQFQVVKDNTSVFKTGTSNIITGHASFSCTVSAGSEYKVRCRGVRGDRYSDWSEYSDNVGTAPSAPSHIVSCAAWSETSVRIGWYAVMNADSYEIEYAEKKWYFDNSDATTTISDIKATHYLKTGLETGKEYFFRVRAVNDAGTSAWTEIKSVSIGKAPAAPTTFSSVTTAIVGEPLFLYWIHNAQDGSSQTYAELELVIGGTTEVKTIKNTTDEDEKDKTSSYALDTLGYTEGTKIYWRVRTAGVTNTFGEWSIQRMIDVYAPPTLQLNMADLNGNPIETLGAFPFHVSALAGPNTQVPTGYYLSIKSNGIYETVDNIGNIKNVNEGDEVYSKYFDITDSLSVDISASDVDLENNISYTMTCTVSMNSGLTAESSVEFAVAWDESVVRPNAEISIDKDTLAAYIRPYYEDYPYVTYKVTHSGSTYTKTSVILPDNLEGMSVIDAYTSTGEMVFSTTYQGESIYFCVAQGTTGVLVEDVLLSVYRREFDGTFTEIAKDLNNTSATFVTDPHPSLDYARYRIVAVTKATGAVSYYDVPGYPVAEKAVIIQWDEDWSEFNTTDEAALEQPPWSGSLLKLPYNIDVSDKHSSDVTLIEYIGRKHPVSYYGTQLGETSSWSMEIAKDDVDTLYALRRLAIWMGDVYVREPSGSGYWANISVSFSQTHCAVTIPVTLDITRVEGGI